MFGGDLHPLVPLPATISSSSSIWIFHLHSDQNATGWHALERFIGGKRIVHLHWNLALFLIFVGWFIPCLFLGHFRRIKATWKSEIVNLEIMTQLTVSFEHKSIVHF